MFIFRSMPNLDDHDIGWHQEDHNYQVNKHTSLLHSITYIASKLVLNFNVVLIILTTIIQEKIIEK